MFIVITSIVLVTRALFSTVAVNRAFAAILPLQLFTLVVTCVLVIRKTNIIPLIFAVITAHAIFSLHVTCFDVTF